MKNEWNILHLFFFCNVLKITTHLNLNLSYFKCSIVTCTGWLPHATAQLQNLLLLPLPTTGTPLAYAPQNVFVDVKLPVPGCIQIEAGQPLFGRNIVNKNCQMNVWVRKALKGPEFCDAILLRNEIWKYEFGKNFHSSHATSCHYHLIGDLLLLYF